jgi:hypothetical protein
MLQKKRPFRPQKSFQHCISSQAWVPALFLPPLRRRAWGWAYFPPLLRRRGGLNFGSGRGYRRGRQYTRRDRPAGRRGDGRHGAFPGNLAGRDGGGDGRGRIGVGRGEHDLRELRVPNNCSCSYSSGLIPEYMLSSICRKGAPSFTNTWNTEKSSPCAASLPVR